MQEEEVGITNILLLWVLILIKRCMKLLKNTPSNFSTNTDLWKILVLVQVGEQKVLKGLYDYLRSSQVYPTVHIELGSGKESKIKYRFKRKI